MQIASKTMETCNKTDLPQTQLLDIPVDLEHPD
jgi:hypothetical protein